MNKGRWAALTTALSVTLAWTGPNVAIATSGFNNITVTSLTIYQAGPSAAPGALIQFTGGTGADNEGCTWSGKGYAWIDWSSASQPDGKAVYATVLGAYLSGKSIGFGLNGCSTNYDGHYYPLVYGINVYP